MDEPRLKLYSQIKTTSNFSNFSILEECFKHYTMIFIIFTVPQYNSINVG